jgi:eukaryotic-like serine/threonine-protein kinase
MAPPLKVTPGQTLDGRFLILSEVGRGGTSSVFKALDLANPQQLVAVKVPLPLYSSGVGSWSMSQREGEIGRSLSHPGILRFVQLSPGQQRGYVVTEYLAGTPLSCLVGRGRRLAEPEALCIMSRLCEAVDYLHRQQIVHYDLKPGNVILCDDGRVVLIDLGTAHKVETGRFAWVVAAPPIASSDYVAPEQIRRRRGQPSVDIYALGAILYEMLAGHPPFEGDDPFVVASIRQIADPRAPRALDSSISCQAEEIVLRALRRDPAQRYQSCAELRADLDHPTAVRVSGLSENLVEVTAWRICLRRMRFVALVGIAPVVLLAGSFRLLWWYLERRH